MKKNKLLLNLVRKAVHVSFKDGKLQEKKINSFIRGFKKLDTSDAIFALSEYVRGLKRELNKRTLEVEAAAPLSGKEMERVQRALHSTFHILHSTFKLNASLLGGIRLKIGDVILDSSISSKVDQVKKAIIN